MARKDKLGASRIAQEYRVWLRSRLVRSTQTQLRAFDRIADKHLARVEEKVAA